MAELVFSVLTPGGGRDGESLALRINGQETDRVPTGPIVPNRLPLDIAVGCDGVWLDDLRLYDRALSRDEINALFSREN